jgi:hypothetical protein
MVSATRPTNRWTGATEIEAMGQACVLRFYGRPDPSEYRKSDVGLIYKHLRSSRSNAASQTPNQH